MSEEVWRTYRINCPERRQKGASECLKCGLPLTHHRMRFELLDFDRAKGIWTLQPVQREGFNPDASANSRTAVVRFTSKEFARLMVIA